MGITIDKAIEIINHYLDYPPEEVRKALVLAIHTMRKYEKIEKIMKKTHEGVITKYQMIEEVLEDVKID